MKARLVRPALFCLVAALALVTGSVSAQNISFEGTVTMLDDGTPVKGALIEALPSTEGRTVRSAKSKKDGTFKIPYAEFGRYRVKASMEGLMMHSVSISVRKRNNQLDFEEGGETGPQQVVPEYDLQPGRKVELQFVMVPESYFARFLTVAGDAKATEKLMQANALTSEGKYAESDALLDELIEKGATSASVFYLKGTNGVAMGNLDDAVTALEKAIELNPEQAGANAQLASIAYGRGELERAADLFGKELEVSPDAVPVAVNRAVVLARLGRPQDAIAAFERVLEMDPTQVEAYTELANLHTDLGDDASAQEVLTRMESYTRPDPALWFNIGAEQSNQERYDAARTCYLKAIELDPVFSEAIREMGYLEIRSGNQPKALEYFERYLELQPDAADADQVRALKQALQKAAAGN